MKQLVRENINFERGLDPKEALGLAGLKAVPGRLNDILRTDYRQHYLHVGKSRWEGDKLVIIGWTEGDPEGAGFKIKIWWDEGIFAFRAEIETYLRDWDNDWRKDYRTIYPIKGKKIEEHIASQLASEIIPNYLSLIYKKN